MYYLVNIQRRYAILDYLNKYSMELLLVLQAPEP